MVGNFRVTAPRLGKDKKEIWIFHRLTGESLAVKEDMFEKAIRFLYKNQNQRTEE